MSCVSGAYGFGRHGPRYSTLLTLIPLCMFEQMGRQSVSCLSGTRPFVKNIDLIQNFPPHIQMPCMQILPNSSFPPYSPSFAFAISLDSHLSSCHRYDASRAPTMHTVSHAHKSLDLPYMRASRVWTVRARTCTRAFSGDEAPVCT